MLFCHYCGTKISRFEIRRKRQMAEQTQCSAFRYTYKCNKCEQLYDYQRKLRHKNLFSHTLQHLQQFCSSMLIMKKLQ
jgi:hypothetical protein